MKTIIITDTLPKTCEDCKLHRDQVSHSIYICECKILGMVGRKQSPPKACPLVLDANNYLFKPEEQSE